MNKIGAKDNLGEVLNELTKQTKCRTNFNVSDIKRLHNEIHTQSELKKFIEYFRIFQDFYEPSLITKSFLRYNQDGQVITGMIILNNKLKNFKIITPQNPLHANCLYKLYTLIKTEESWNRFYEFWKQRKNKYCLGMILLKYRTEGRNAKVN